MSLLLIEDQAELRRIEKAGFIKPIAKDQWRTSDLIRGFAKWAREAMTICDGITLAKAFGVSTARVSQLDRDGFISPVGGRRGKYNWMDAVNGYIKFLRDENRQTSKSAAESRIRDAKAQDIEVRTAERLGKLVPLEVFEQMIDEIVGAVRTAFSGLAASCTRDLVLRRVIEREVNARLRQIAEDAMAKAIRLEAGRSPHDAVRADGAGPLGSSE